MKALVDSERLNALLEWYFEVLGEDIVSVVIADRDGLLMASKSKEENLDDETIGGLSALIEPVLKRISSEFKSSGFGAGTIDVEDYRLIFVEAGDHAILITICDLISSIDEVFPYAYIAAEKVSRIFDGRTVSPVIPQIKKTSNISFEGKNTEFKKLEAQGTFAYKVILGGDGAVGKTSLIQTFVQGQFQQDYKATIGTSIMKKECNFKGWDSSVRFMIWDLAGQKQFTRVRQTYLTNAKGGFLVFDVTRMDTFENINQWYKETIRGAGEDINLMLIGNKIDLKNERVVTTEMGKGLADELDLPYFETSALNNDIVEEAFRTLAFQMIQDKVELK